MKIWKHAALATALVAAAGAGAALAPVANGQTVAVAPRAASVISFGSGSHIGISISDVDPADTKAGQAGGVRIDDVTDDSPAAKAGLREKDVIVEFDGERIRSARQFARLVQETVPGRKVQAAILRDGQRSTVTVEPAESGDWLRDTEPFRMLEELRGARIAPPATFVRPSRPGRDFVPDVETFFARGNALGITIGDLSPQLAEYFGTKEGVLVNSVLDDSAASRAGLKAGDVVTAINGKAVESTTELRREIQAVRAGQEFTVMVMRDKKPVALKGTIEERKAPRRTYRSVI